MLHETELWMNETSAEYCERRVTGLLSAVKAIVKFPDCEILRHMYELEVARDRLSEILDKAEGK